MPWIDSDPNGRVLSYNYIRAITVMHRVQDKVKPEHMNLVEEAYQEFVDYAEEVPSKERITKHPSYVLTSKPVFRLDKASTKCRVVVNASLPDIKDNLKSLNKRLIMELIPKVKCKKYFVTVDIKKML
ncbi:unnamed protein product [Lepeophtheirus salmonis]|uniref:(salmon louse) hypothetical protein n=1 Tax=Lepeophtheirus salmonis TaxID=72036 RepID=A0A7R8CFB3_LEPSM|nr:unnamed protein product [Lepeophtheirus salmonis]CAF2798486.1 unnamed protein product [Lepeophtheirus salmonis]